MRFIKWIVGITIAVIIAIPVIGMIALQMLDLNEFKPQIADLVREQTGRELVVSGDISPVFGMKPSLNIGKLTLSNAKWAKTKQMVEVGESYVVLDLLPLLKGDISIETLRFSGVTVELQKTKKGTANWEMKPAKKDEPKESKGEEKEAVEAKTPAAIPQIGNVEVSKLKLRFRDGKSGQDITANISKLTFDGTRNPKATIVARLGKVAANLYVTADNMDNLLSGTAKVTLNVKGDNGEKIDLNGSLNEFLKTQQFQFALDASGNNLSSFAKLMGGKAPAIPAFKIKANLSGTPNLVYAKNLDAVVDKLHAKADVTANLKTMIVTAKNLSASQDNIKVKASVKANLNTKIITVKNLNASQDKLNATGSLTVNLAKKKPYVKGSLSVPSYHASAKQGLLVDEAISSLASSFSLISDAYAETSKRVIPNMDIPTKGLDVVDADLQVNIGKVVTAKHTLSNVKTKIALHNSVAKLNPASFNTMGAGFTTYLTLNAAKETPVINVKLTSNGLTLERLIKGLTGKADANGGAMTNSISLNGSGKNLHALLTTLSGDMTSLVKNATYKKPSKMMQANDFLELLQGKSHGDKIKIKCYAHKFNIASGVMKPKYLALDAAGAKVEGEGSINLVKEKLALTLYPRSKTIGLADLVVPLKVGGTFANPSVYPDPKGAIKTAGKVAIALTGVPGVAAIAGNVIGNKLDLFSSKNPCFDAEKQANPADTKTNLKSSEDAIKAKAKSVEKNIRNLRDAKKGELKDIKKNLKDLEGGLKDLKNLF